MHETLLNEWRNRRINECMNFELIDWLNEWMKLIENNDWRNGWLTKWMKLNETDMKWNEMEWNELNKWMHEWVNVSMSSWTDGWMDDWMNESEQWRFEINCCW